MLTCLISILNADRVIQHVNIIIINHFLLKLNLIFQAPIIRWFNICSNYNTDKISLFLFLRFVLWVLSCVLWWTNTKRCSRKRSYSTISRNPSDCPCIRTCHQHFLNCYIYIFMLVADIFLVWSYLLFKKLFFMKSLIIEN